jgi:hypothetical protein
MSMNRFVHAGAWIIGFIAVFVAPEFVHAAIPSLQPITTAACTCAGSAPDWGCALQIFQIVLNDAVALGTILITLYLAWAGATFMLTPTNPEAHTKARRRVMNAVIGLFIVLAAYLFIDSLLGVIYNKTASADGVSQLGDWNSLLFGGKNCIALAPKFTPLPGLGGPGNTTGSIAPTQPQQPSQPAQQATSTPPTGACGAKTHLNCAKAVAWLQNNVHTTNQYGGYCLTAIQHALNAGGLTLWCGAPPGHSGYAGYCNSSLQQLNFTSLGSSDPNPQPADILVIQDSGGRKIGHITMWTGSAWVSDTIQLPESPPGNPYGAAGYNPQYWRP